MAVKKVLLTVAISGMAWGALTLPASAETPLDGLAPVGEAPTAPPLPAPLGEAPAAPPLPAPLGEAPAAPALPELFAPAPERPPSAPAGVSPEDCIAAGGNVERPQDGGPGYECEGGDDDGMPVRE